MGFRRHRIVTDGIRLRYLRISTVLAFDPYTTPLSSGSKLRITKNLFVSRRSMLSPLIDSNFRVGRHRTFLERFQSRARLGVSVVQMTQGQFHVHLLVLHLLHRGLKLGNDLEHRALHT